MDDFSRALVALGRYLRSVDYRFTTVTPASHARVNARRGAKHARDLRDALGWSRPFEPGLLPADLLDELEAARVVKRSGKRRKSVARFSTLGEGLYAHSAFPTEGEDAVFFGPDTYRFVAFLRAHLGPARRVVDVGCGSGVGGMVWAPRAERVVLADINESALSFARANAELAGLTNVETVVSDVLDSVPGPIDVVVANPPYLVDADERAYRHGGGDLGTELGVRIVRDALARLDKGGRLLVYTGAPIVGGRDVFLAAVMPVLSDAGARYSYAELDVDVFGEELEGPAYAAAGVERIAAVGLAARLHT